MGKWVCVAMIGGYHTVGYLDELGFKNSEKEYLKVKNKADKKVKGFEMMNLEMPKKNIANASEHLIRNLERH